MWQSEFKGHVGNRNLVPILLLSEHALKLGAGAAGGAVKQVPILLLSEHALKPCLVRNDCNSLI